MIKGIPDGWELVRIGQAMLGDYWLGSDGRIEKWEFATLSCVKNYVIIRKIEKPKRYRPFANAAEYKPHRCRWVSHKSNPDSYVRIDGYGNKGVTIQGNAHDFSELFEDRTFDDGTPFGIEVTE